MNRAQRIAEVIWPEDAASNWLGMKLEEVRAGYAKVTNQKGETIAVFRGRSATVKGTWIE